MPDEDAALARILQVEEARRMAREEALEDVPRWRFRRRRALEEQVSRRRAREDNLRDAVETASPDDSR